MLYYIALVPVKYSVFSLYTFFVKEFTFFKKEFTIFKNEFTFFKKEFIFSKKNLLYFHKGPKFGEEYFPEKVQIWSILGSFSRKVRNN